MMHLESHILQASILKHSTIKKQNYANQKQKIILQVNFLRLKKRMMPCCKKWNGQQEQKMQNIILRLLLAKHTIYIEQKKIGYFYIKDKDNKYLSIDYKDAQLEYNIKWITKEEILLNDDNCLWQLFDTNINKPRTLKVINNSNMEDNTFRCLGEDLDMISNTTNSYWDDFNNSTNLMLKAKINKSTSQIDSKSNYSYSVIDIDNEEGNIQNKECYWTHNSHGHTAIDYDTYKSGSHFTSDLWNIQFIFKIQDFLLSPGRNE